MEIWGLMGRIFTILVYLQPVLWILLFDSDLDFNNDTFIKWFYGIGALTCFIVFYLNLRIEFYTTKLLAVYILMVLLATTLFNMKWDFKTSMCMAFLTVFFNSYYWEFIIHLTAYVQQKGFVANDLLQMFHLLPALFFHYRFKWRNRRRVLTYLLYGLMFSSIVTWFNVDLRFGLLSYFYGRFPYNLILNNERILMLNRFVCLFILIYIFEYATIIEKKRKDYSLCR
jgi:hypothetical protein